MSPLENTLTSTDFAAAARQARPRVSVIVPTFNRASLLAASLQSVLAQSFRDFEVIVVDDGSTDETPQILQQFVDERIRVITQMHGGASKARNVGVASARGELIAFQDSDDLWLPEKLRSQVALLDERPEVGWVYCDINFFGSANAESRPSAFAACPPRRGEILREMLLHGCPISTPSVVVRANCLKGVGGFDETLSIGEDKDLWLRLAAMSPVDYVPTALVRVHRPADRNENYDPLAALEVRCTIVSRALAASPALARSFSAKELYRVRDRNRFELAHAHLSNGDRQQARKVLAQVPITRFPLRTAAYYFGTLAPKWFVKLSKIRRRLITSVVPRRDRLP